MPPALAQTFQELSPRLNPPQHAWRGMAIWGAAVALFIALFLQGFVAVGVGAWAVGIVYILYDTALLLFVMMQTRGMARPPVFSGANRVRVGVIVAAYNEASVLEATIEALRQQDTPPDVIVIADDGSDDDTAGVLAHVYGLTAPALGTLSAPAPADSTIHWLRLSVPSAGAVNP